MTVNPIGISNPNQPIDPTSFQTRMQQALAPVAELFGESPDQLMSELQSGNTSLSALAASKGISQTDLVNTIKSGLQQSAPNNGTALSDTQLTNLADRIANRKHGVHHHHHHGGNAAVSATSTSTDPTATTSSSASDTTMDALQQLLNADASTSVDQSF